MIQNIKHHESMTLAYSARKKSASIKVIWRGSLRLFIYAHSSSIHGVFGWLDLLLNLFFDASLKSHLPSSLIRSPMESREHKRWVSTHQGFHGYTYKGCPSPLYLLLVFGTFYKNPHKDIYIHQYILTLYV